jgi:hypothetical protein
MSRVHIGIGQRHVTGIVAANERERHRDAAFRQHPAIG